MHGDWNPWAELGRRPHIKVRWVDHGRPGCIDFRSNTITMLRGGTVAIRRSVLTHELVHEERGTFPRWLRPREEAVVREGSARRLIPLRDLLVTLAWARDEHEAAEDLSVDVSTFRTRLERLVHPAEVARVTTVLRARGEIP